MRNNKSKLEKLYKVKELSAADWFPWKEGTIRKLIKDGSLKTINLRGGEKRQTLRITESEVERFMQAIGIFKK